jgi:hypothetical protein
VTYGQQVKRKKDRAKGKERDKGGRDKGGRHKEEDTKEEDTKEEEEVESLK